VPSAGIDASANPGEWTNPLNRTWAIDRSFPFAVTAEQVISIVPARARIIFEGDHFLDGGTLQFYGQAQEVVVDSMVGERIAGFVAWGQWRGWYLPPCGTMGRPPCPPGPPPRPVRGDLHSSKETRSRKDAIRGVEGKSDPLGRVTRLGGEMGNGIMMNTQLMYLDNKILEGNKIVRWSAEGQGFAKFYNGATFSVQAVNIEKPPPNCTTGEC
jgi:hypothetical protein